ncbi:C6 transcription factor [Fusarium mexicanum]|uniref:C6 transcription factor n=1 Tax=Fusarium mexicanum TaxID=751941 RepID=A0A8H5MPR9_9HYPO|nr:C6 transcription factor [Fusarium mexicanum]
MIVPAQLRKGTNRYLFEHFLHVTAKRMAGRTYPENPFLSCNLKIASGSTIMQHAILAISASHLLYKRPDMAEICASHYAIVLRAMKHAVTRWKTLDSCDQIALLATALALCWFETIDVNTRGALYHHLEASKFMFQTVKRRLKDHDPSLFGFLAEQYAYLATVSNITLRSARFDPEMNRTLSLPSLGLLNKGSNFYGCLFGCSHLVYETIPMICDLAKSRIKEGIAPSETSYQQYEYILGELKAWQPTQRYFSKDFGYAGRLYREACLIFLESSFQGPDTPSLELYAAVEPCLACFLEVFAKISYESPSWTTVMWPILTAGSHMRCLKQRDQLSDIILNSTFDMRAVDNTLHPLKLLWEKMAFDDCYYGSYGLEKVLKECGITMCVG